MGEWWYQGKLQSGGDSRAEASMLCQCESGNRDFQRGHLVQKHGDSESTVCLKNCHYSLQFKIFDVSGSGLSYETWGEVRSWGVLSVKDIILRRP